MEILIIWLLFGVVSAVVASNKGRSGFGWFVLGVLLGPFGFILSLVVPKNQRAIEREAVASGNMKKCPFCAELIRAAAVVCRYCGRELASNEPAKPVCLAQTLGPRPVSSRGGAIAVLQFAGVICMAIAVWQLSVLAFSRRIGLFWRCVLVFLFVNSIGFSRLFALRSEGGWMWRFPLP